MKFLALFVFGVLCLPAQQERSSSTLNNQRIIQLVRSGVTIDEIIRLISTASETNFELTPGALDSLNKAGVSATVIKAMAGKQLALPASGPSPQNSMANIQPDQQASTSGSPETMPRVTIFLGGSYLRLHASGAEASQVLGVPDFVLQQRNLNFNLYGWNSNATENLNSWFAAEFDASGLYGLPVPSFLCSASSLSNALSCLSANPVRPSVITKLHTFTFGRAFRSATAEG